MDQQDGSPIVEYPKRSWGLLRDETYYPRALSTAVLKITLPLAGVYLVVSLLDHYDVASVGLSLTLLCLAAIAYAVIKLRRKLQRERSRQPTTPPGGAVTIDEWEAGHKPDFYRKKRHPKAFFKSSSWWLVIAYASGYICWSTFADGTVVYVMMFIISTVLISAVTIRNHRHDFHILHPLKYFRATAHWYLTLVGGVVVGTGVIVVDSVWAGILIALTMLVFCCLMIYRQYRLWSIRPIECDPDDGILRIYQNGIEWLLARGSAPDSYPIDQIEIVTPGQSWFELLLFHSSQPLSLKVTEPDGREMTVRIPDVVNVDHLLVIQSYRQWLSRENVRQQKAIVSLLQEGNALLREQTDLIRGQQDAG
jgi:hypothetical protein